MTGDGHARVGDFAHQGGRVAVRHHDWVTGIYVSAQGAEPGLRVSAFEVILRQPECL
jgi:hypothetical protein